ncbi:PDZK1-interacting protein 1 isoform X1 [Anoplopoma fimbria]|uniref:PDZK1-interacting protein 1 isoform X1 n=1 Tax=Anoplopoma fimbria TaxID=229290 RepID=UPI0023EBB577|nr:PDZK1-interacting protein 1 isoform X1 [Anoplopoma fimbria]
MGKLWAVISCLLLSVGAVTAQGAQNSKRLLPQWLTGLIAVSGFLFLIFVIFLVKKAWFEEPKSDSGGRKERHTIELGTMWKKTSVESVIENEYVDGNTYETELDMVRSKKDMNTYDNMVIDATDDKATVM